MELKQIKRAEAAALAAVGKPLRIRIDSNTFVSGTITACRMIGSIEKATTVKPQFEVTMSCGTNGTERKFTVNKLP